MARGIAYAVTFGTDRIERRAQRLPTLNFFDCIQERALADHLAHLGSTLAADRGTDALIPWNSEPKSWRMHSAGPPGNSARAPRPRVTEPVSPGRGRRACSVHAGGGYTAITPYSRPHLHFHFSSSCDPFGCFPISHGTVTEQRALLHYANRLIRPRPSALLNVD